MLENEISNTAENEYALYKVLRNEKFSSVALGMQNLPFRFES